MCVSSEMTGGEALNREVQKECLSRFPSPHVDVRRARWHKRPTDCVGVLAQHIAQCLLLSSAYVRTQPLPFQPSHLFHPIPELLGASGKCWIVVAEPWFPDFPASSCRPRNPLPNGAWLAPYRGWRQENKCS